MNQKWCAILYAIGVLFVDYGEKVLILLVAYDFECLLKLYLNEWYMIVLCICVQIGVIYVLFLIIGYVFILLHIIISHFIFRDV